MAIDSKLRGCDLVHLRVRDVFAAGQVRERASITQRKTGRPVRFEITEPANLWNAGSRTRRWWARSFSGQAASTTVLTFPPGSVAESCVAGLLPSVSSRAPSCAGNYLSFNIRRDTAATIRISTGEPPELESRHLPGEPLSLLTSAN
jgi:hypothetical protein